MASPTQHDADLLLKLYDLRREQTLRTARAWLIKNFRPDSLEELYKLCPVGSQEHAYFRQVTTYWEMVASFMTSGLLHPELFFQNNRELLVVWIRLHKVVPSLRTANGDPIAYRNLEAVAKQYVEWLNSQDPGIYPALVDRVK